MPQATTNTTQANRPKQKPIQCVQYVIGCIMDGVTFDQMQSRIEFKPKRLDSFWHITVGAQIVADRIAPQTVRDQLTELLRFIDDLLDKKFAEVCKDGD